jgi:hypothetical protein
VLPPGSKGKGKPDKKESSTGGDNDQCSAAQTTVQVKPSTSSVSTKPGQSFQESIRNTPVSDAALIAEGSDLQGLVIVPWDEADEDIASNFGLVSGPPGSCFEDADGLLELSSKQREALHGWHRFPELLRSSKKTSGLQPAVLASSPTSKIIRQGLVGDCSFLSALSVLAEYEQRFGERVLSSIIYPRDNNGDPVYNDYGQYGCRFFLNGTMRKVVIDDRVPVRGNGQLLCAHSSREHELWVTLLEKSFAKIMGSSYDMQGSNPGTDIFHLTGWVPETIPLDTKGSDRDASSWADVFSTAERGYRDGRCIVCVGTSELSDAAPDAEARRLGHVEGVSASTGLVARHAYPVLNCKTFGQHRLLHLKNPWGRIRWRGRFSPGDTSSWTAIAKAVGRAALEESIGKIPSAGSTDDGHFWIAWEDVLKHFSHLYLCWAPNALGFHRMEVHGSWDPEPFFSRSSLPDDTHLVAWNPQFLLRLNEPLPSDGSTGDTNGIWVLLSRHVKIRADISSRYVAAHIYNGGQRLCCPDAPQEMGVYSNGECALVKLSGKAGQGQTDFVIVVSQHANKVAFNFTLQVYSAVPGTLTPLPPLIAQDCQASGQADGSWTAETSGGCSNDMWAYFRNPHWRVDVPRGGLAKFILFVECPAEFSVNVRLFKGAVARPEELRSAESSGAYRQGCCVLSLTNVDEGPHVLVVSTFRPGLRGDYRLAWHAGQTIQLRPQPYPFTAPLPPPLECLARLVRPGVNTRFRLTSSEAAETSFVSVRLQSDAKAGPPPLIGIFAEPPGCNPQADEVSMGLVLADCEVLQETFAGSYFSSSGAAVVLSAELPPGGSFILELLAPRGGNSSSAVYINSDKTLAIHDIKFDEDDIWQQGARRNGTHAPSVRLESDPVGVGRMQV